MKRCLINFFAALAMAGAATVWADARKLRYAAGVVLIVLGYIYNRWQDKIREWL